MPPGGAEPRSGHVREGVAAALAMAALGAMAGGTFTGWPARPMAGGAGVLGVILAVLTARARRQVAVQIVSMGVIVGAGVAALISAGLQDLSLFGSVLDRAATEGHSLPVPLPFSGEWRFLVVVLLAGTGYGAGWLATDLGRPRLALLLPLPLLVFTAIAQPPAVQTVDAVTAFVLYVLALAALYRDTAPEGGLRLSAGFEAKRMLRAAVLVALVAAGLFQADRASFLFPPPAVDPTRTAQLPAPASGNALADRVLFTVRAQTVGPWRTGELDVYDGSSWRLPPAALQQATAVGTQGQLEAHENAREQASFTIARLDGPDLPVPVGATQLVSSSLSLSYLQRSGGLQLGPGDLPKGATYAVSYTPLPTDSQLRSAGLAAGDTLDLRVPPMPAAVRSLLAPAPKSGWARADWARRQLLSRVQVSGPGQPGAVPPSMVADMLAGTLQPNPYQLVAAEALLERWAGVPARIGFGYQGGDHRNGVLEVHPKHAATWLEVHFNGLGWVPVTGGPLRAVETIGTNGNASAAGAGGETSTVPGAIPGTDVVVNLFVPIDVVTPVPDFEFIRWIAILVGGGLLLLAAIYLLWPVPYKALRRARRRAWARRTGRRARIAVAYADFRELAVDLGDDHGSETPLHFLEQVVPDLEHTELAWLVTRTLWGDLAPEAGDVVAAEALGRSLRSRLARGQPPAMRAAAALSRLSLRHPYWHALRDAALKEPRKERRAA